MACSVGRRSCPHGILILLLLPLVVLGPPPAPALAETSWLSVPPRVPAKIADPKETRSGIGWYPADDRISVLLGGLMPLVGAAEPGDGWGVFVDGNVSLELGVDGAFFPLETVDGRFGIRGEAARGVWRGVLRIEHLSAHQADGDSTVTYRGKTVSRETWSLEVGAAPRLTYAYVRAGTAWHSVPWADGWNLAAGAERCLGDGAWSPLLGLNWSADAASSHRSAWSLFAGFGVLDRRTLRVGARWYRGPGPSAQYENRTSEHWGLEIHFRPEAPGSR